MRPKLTYANVTATLALIIAVGGASALAATQLPKNSVGTKQLKKGSVTSAKVKKHTLTGENINLDQLGIVPNASHATVAANADLAANASQLGGQSAASYARTQLEPVHYVGTLGEPNFGPGCENYEPKNYESVGFYKDSFGIVHLVGSGKSCSIGSVFTLPSGFRPTKSQLFTDKYEEIVVAPAGTVICYGTTAPDLDGITFRAES